jgi:putative flippase GtrA
MATRRRNLSRQLARYLLIGGFNTLFGYALFALLNWSFAGLGSYSYMYAAVLSNPIAITVAFLGNKWFVFRTRGNYLGEFLRCLGVYGSTMLLGLAALPILVHLLRHMLSRPELASYLAAALLTAASALFSFLGHKTFSFRQALRQQSRPPAHESTADSQSMK